MSLVVVDLPCRRCGARVSWGGKVTLSLEFYGPLEGCPGDVRHVRTVYLCPACRDALDAWLEGGRAAPSYAAGEGESRVGVGGSGG